MDLIPRGSPTLIPIPKRAISVAAGGHHSVVLAHDGEVYTFGNHSKGQLGRETTDEVSVASAACSGQKLEEAFLLTLTYALTWLFLFFLKNEPTPVTLSFIFV